MTHAEDDLDDLDDLEDFPPYLLPGRSRPHDLRALADAYFAGLKIGHMHNGEQGLGAVELDVIEILGLPGHDIDGMPCEVPNNVGTYAWHLWKCLPRYLRLHWKRTRGIATEPPWNTHGNK